MTSFEQGIVKHAQECGLSDTWIAHILKRAMAHPESQRMLKQLPYEESSLDDTEQLSHLLAQHDIDEQMQAYLNEHLSGETRRISA
jgi:hypothetical protein